MVGQVRSGGAMTPRNGLTDALVRSRAVVVFDIFFDNPVQLGSAPNEHVIQAFAFQALHEALADRIGQGSLKGG
jgi:hypothetical protein